MFDPEPTRTKGTESAYKSTYQRLSNQAARELGVHPPAFVPGACMLVGWLLAARGRWAGATIRAYAAAIRYVLERAVAKSPGSQDLRTALDTLNAGPMPAPRVEGPARTSARKRKAARPEEMQAVLDALRASSHPHAPVAVGLLEYGAELGLRPREWLGASIKDGWLVVPNAKATNGRGNGRTRSLDLAAFPGESVDRLTVFLARVAGTTEKAWDKVLYPAARGQLRAANAKAAKEVRTLRGRPIAFYTGRHVATGRAKATMDRDAVGALLGHRTDRTATTHYARARTAKGWGPLKTAPSSELVATVQPRYRARGSAPDPATPKP